MIDELITNQPISVLVELNPELFSALQAHLSTRSGADFDHTIEQAIALYLALCCEN